MFIIIQKERYGLEGKVAGPIITIYHNSEVYYVNNKGMALRERLQGKL